MRQDRRVISSSSTPTSLPLLCTFCRNVTVLLFICLISSSCTDCQLWSNFGIVIVTAMPMVLVDNNKATCYDVDAIRDAIIRIHYTAPDMEFDDSHPLSAAGSSKAYITVNVKPRNRVYETDLHHAPVRDRLRPLAHTITKKEDMLYHTMELDGTAQICIRATADTGKPNNHGMVFGLRITTSDEEPDLLRMKEKDAKPVNVDEHLSHVEMELRRITMSIDSVLKEADNNRERDMKFHKQTMAMHSATTFWPIVQVCIILMTGFTQTSHIIHFFKSRRII